MRKLSGFILLSFFIVSCGNKRPSDVLPMEKMQEVIWDMLKAGEFLDGYVFNYDTSARRPSETAAWYEKVYRLHNITKAQFEKSYAYYRDNPALMKEMLDSLGKREAPSDTAKLAGMADSSRQALTKKDSAFKRVNPVIPGILSDTLSLPAKRQRKLIDSIKQSRLLKRKQRLEQ